MWVGGQQPPTVSPSPEVPRQQDGSPIGGHRPGGRAIRLVWEGCGGESSSSSSPPPVLDLAFRWAQRLQGYIGGGGESTPPPLRLLHRGASKPRKPAGLGGSRTQGGLLVLLLLLLLQTRAPGGACRAWPGPGPQVSLVHPEARCCLLPLTVRRLAPRGRGLPRPRSAGSSQKKTLEIAPAASKSNFIASGGGGTTSPRMLRGG